MTGEIRMRWFTKLLTTFIILNIIFLNISGSCNYFTYEAKAATFDAINSPDVFLKQKNGDKQCTLVAATMMIRRAAMLSGNTNWSDITVDKVKEQAWIEGKGLRYSFTYAGISVKKASFGADPVSESITLLEQHPEGIVVYNPNRTPNPHAILLTDYTNQIFYCADPAGAVTSGRIPNSSALVQVKDVKSYWYVSSPKVSVTSPSTTYEENSILAIDISTYTTILSQTNFPFDGTEKKPGVTIMGLIENTDYTVSYINNINPGTASVIITGIGAYSGVISKSYEIVDTSLSDACNKIKIVLSKKAIKKKETAVVMVTLPDSLKLVKKYSSSLSGRYQEVKLNYVSNNKKIVTVNSNGKITGKKIGTATIFVTAELADGTKKTFSLIIKVKEY